MTLEKENDEPTAAMDLGRFNGVISLGYEGPTIAFAALSDFFKKSFY